MEAVGLAPFIRPRTNGCSGKCPCQGKWINCDYYIDKTAQAWRLNHKQIEKEILEYYMFHFSGTWGMHDLYTSG